MRRKKNLIILLIFCFISGIGYTSAYNGIPKPADTDMEWGISVGDTFTWVVSKSNESKGFLPKGSKFELTVTMIENVTVFPGFPADRIKVNFSVYNSKTKLTSVILSNDTFVTFDTAFNSTDFYAPFYDHGFFMPLDYYEGFASGFIIKLAVYFNFNIFANGFVNETYVVYALNTTTDILCLWEFNEYFVTETLTIYQGSLSNIQYLLLLDGKSGDKDIPLGNFYLIPFGISLCAMTYIVFKKKSARERVKL